MSPPTNVLAAIAILVLGWLGAARLRRVVRRAMEKSGRDALLVSLAASMAYIAVTACIVIAALGKLGVCMTTFVATLGAAGLAIGLVLQGSLANLAAGVLLIIFRPFKLDDLVEAARVSGTGEGIHLFTTHLRTPDNRAVVVPNAKITADTITSYAARGIRRVDMMIGVGYGEDVRKVKATLDDILSQDKRVLRDQPPVIGVLELADSSVNLVVRPWTQTPDYWDVYFETMEKVKARFDDEGINIPFPRHDVHLYQQAARQLASRRSRTVWPVRSRSRAKGDSRFSAKRQSGSGRTSDLAHPA